MSVTTTANPSTYSLVATLADYDLHHSVEPFDTSLNSHQPPPDLVSPSTWPTSARRVPRYRPINRELDQGLRRVYLNNAERAFVLVMFTGVFLEASAAKIWRATMGRMWDIRYKIGGEW